MKYKITFAWRDKLEGILIGRKEASKFCSEPELTRGYVHGEASVKESHRQRSRRLGRAFFVKRD